MSDTNTSSPAFQAAYESARSGGLAGVNQHGMPVSREVVQQRAVEQFRAESSNYFDHATGTPNFMHNPGTGEHYDVTVDPAGWLQAIGYEAVNARGEVVTPTPAQARQLAQAIARNAAMNADYPGAATGVSANDPALPAHLARVTGRRLY